MSKSCSFDIISETDMAEVKNAINQTMMEIRQRFDFKNSKSEISLDEKQNQIVLISDDDHKMKSVIDVLEGKLTKRKVSLQALEYGNLEDAASGTVRKIARIQQGIEQEKSKAIIKHIKGMKIKVQGQFMDNQVRVTGKSRDDLQEVIQSLKQKDFGVALQFTNYR